MITWGDVTACFDADKSHVLRELDRQRNLWSMSFLSTGDRTTTQLCLYVVFARDIGAVELSPHMSLIVVGEPDAQDLARLDAMDNCLWTEEGSASLASYSALTEALSEQYYIGYLMYQIHDHIYHNRGIQVIVDEIADFFKLPVSVMDSAFRFIARSQHYVEQSGDLDARLDPNSEELTEEVLMVLERHGFLDKVMSATKPVHLTIHDSAWFVPVLVNNVKAAYLTIYEHASQPDAQLQEQYVYALPLIAAAISSEISKSSFYLYNKASYFTYIFSLMLERDRVDTDDIRSRLRIFGYDLRRELYLLCLDLPHGASSGLTHTTLADTLKNTFRNSIYVSRDHMLVFLISRSEHDLVNDDELVRWNRTLRSTGVRAGLVGPFEGVGEVKRRLLLAQQALAVGNRRGAASSSTSNLFRFEDCQVDAFLTCMGEGLDAHDYCYAPFMALVDYDEVHHTELVATLKEHLRHPKEVGSICDTLCIHKNTLYKRLDRIRAVMGTDFTSAEEIMRIQLTMHILGMAD